uniref:Uncharacterized protein n=1 Tax=Kalanchoe fedtschenkoi TaxID=63787 RepID=A0A7N0UWH4_KALFE
MRSCLLSLHKPAALAATENNHKEGTTLQKSALKSIKDEADMTPKTSTKRKHDEENKSESKDYGEELVGSKKRHKVLYADSNSKDDFKAVAKAKTDSSKEEGKSKAKVEIGKKLGRGTTLQKSALKSIKDEADMTRKTSTKRKHDEENKSESKDYGEELSFDSDKKRHKVLYADSNSNDDSKAVAKAKTDSSKEEGKSKAKVEIGKKLGRPRADVSKSASRSKSDEPSTDSAGKSKGVESKRTDKSTVEVEDVQSSGKSKRGDSKTIIKGKSDSKTASKAEAEITSIKQKGPKGKATKSGDETPVTKTAGKMKTREPSKSKSGFAIKEDTSKFQAICVLQLSHVT